MSYYHGSRLVIDLFRYPAFWPELGKPRQYGPVFSVEQVLYIDPYI